jgi:hypothetical protein
MLYVTEETESPVAVVTTAPRVQLFTPVVAVPALEASWAVMPVDALVAVEAGSPVLYAPEPDAGRDQKRFPATVFAVPVAPCGIVEVTSAETGVAALAVENEVAAGDETTRAIMLRVSVIAKPVGKLNVTGMICSTPARAPVTFATVIDDGLATDGTAEAGTTEVRTPIPKAATATSATRLKVVFVDICFLSISRSREFPPVGFG